MSELPHFHTVNRTQSRIKCEVTDRLRGRETIEENKTVRQVFVLTLSNSFRERGLTIAKCCKSAP